MTKHPHKASVDENFLVWRHLALEGEGDIPWAQIEAEIDQVMGIDEIHLNKERHSLSVAYDASYKTLEDVEKILDAHFLRTAQGWWTRTKKSWYEFTDQNIKDNVKHSPWSCHSDKREHSKKRF